jgi:hypothetical protein
MSSVSRGMSFLFSRDRLNVAIFRAQALAGHCLLTEASPVAMFHD